MGLRKYTIVRASLHYTLPFTRPFLSFRDVPERFFAMCYDNVKTVAVSPGDFGASFGNNLGDLAARYNVLGSKTGATLFVDRLVFDFPNINLSDMPTVLAVMTAIHDGFSQAFPEAIYERVDAESYTHMDVGSAEAVEELLRPFKVGAVQTIFGTSVIERPAGKINLVAEDQSWSCTLSLENSLMQPTAVFAVMNFSLRKQTSATTFSQKLEEGRGPAAKCLAVMGLEAENAVS